MTGSRPRALGWGSVSSKTVFVKGCKYVHAWWRAGRSDGYRNKTAAHYTVTQ